MAKSWTGAFHNPIMKHIYLSVVLVSLVAISYGQKPELIIPSFHSALVSEIKCTPDGLLMVSGGSDQALKIWDYQKGKELKSFPTESDIEDINISSNGKYAIATDMENLYLVDLHQVKLIQKIKLEFRARTVDISNDGQTIYYGYNEDTVQKIVKCNQQGNNVQLIFKKTVPAYYVSLNKLDLSPDERFLLAINGDEEYMLDLQNQAFEKKLNNAMLFLPNNLYLTFDGSSFSAFDPATGVQKWTKTFSRITTSQKYWTAEKFFIDVKGKNLSFSMANGRNELLLYGNYDTGIFKEKRNFLNITETISRIAKKENDLIVQTSSPYSFQIMDFETQKIKKTIGEPLMLSRHMDVAMQNFTFSFASVFNDKIKRVHLENAKLNVQTLDSKDGMNEIKISANGLVTAATNELGTEKNIKIFKEDQLVYTSPDYILEDKFLALALSLDGQYMASLFKEKLNVVDVQSGTILFTKTFKGEFAKYPSGQLMFSKDKLLVSFSPSSTHSPHNDDDKSFKCYNLSSKSLLWSQFADYSHLAFTPKGNIVCSKAAWEILTLNSSSGSVFYSKKLNERLSYSRTYAYNQDFSKLALEDGLIINIIDLNSGNIITSLKGATAQVWSFGFYNHEFLISSGDDNVIRLWDIKNGKFLAQMIFYDETNDWVTVTPNGLFDGSNHAIENMYYTKGKTFIPLDQLYEQFYTPNLLEQLISREIQPSPIEIDDIKSPPSVRIEYKKGQRNLIVEDDTEEELITTETEEAIIKLIANAPNDKIAELRLFHNGKLVGGASRELFVEDDEPGEKEQSYTIRLLPGQNTFRAIAVNSQRTESAPAILRIDYQPKANSATPVTRNKGMTLHLVVVGINEYKNRKYNLNYAYADAESFKNAIESGMKSVTTQIKTQFVSNADANKNGILTAMESVRKTAQSQDIFVFYYAGHGVMSEGIGSTKKDFYLVPHDVTQLYGADEALAIKGISATEMKQIASGIAAQKQLFILDACQSAGAVESIAMRGAAEEKAIAQLARSTGTHWLTASGSEQYATEFAQLGHGVFTYALLEGLKGKADSGDKRVTINELKAWLETQVPELTQKYKGTPQYPASYGYGQDFPLTVVK